MKKGIIIGAFAVLAIVAIGYAAVWKTGIGRMTFGPDEIGTQAAKTKIQDFVGKNLVAPGTEISVSDPIKEAGLYMATVTVGKQSVPVFLSLDGKKLFPSGMDTEPKKETAATTDAAPAAEVPKTAKPDVKLFVMSYCPYGTQIEKGILPVLATLGDKIDFSLEFVSYSMHNSKATGDRKELDENLRQYCIRTQEPKKLSAYLECFLKKGQGTEAACMKTAGIDATKNISCMKQADTQFDVTKNFNDESTYQGSFPPFNTDKTDNEVYSVQGSPTLVINGVTADTERDPASILKTICASFDTAPAECAKALSSTAPAAGFGDGTASAGATSGAACGN
ncbi:MAG: hypothetical protein HGA31_04395 [Candidatus Moranbacteria bacterium]|nr:hypothetical protein [Candidatus Moranbacteria bacterium]